ncbi:MAG: DUF4430 domain-containing protein [Solirubrobacterales bacterium]|nr:DUF4430 domain-containing protein [Solirubrobacterales bacterium]
MIRPVSALLIAACAVIGAGCGSSGPTGPTTSVTVTRDFGASEIARTQTVDSTNGLTALRQLEAVHKVTTAYGGRYVKSINATAEDGDSSWLFYVDGVESDQGATSVRLKPGQVVQWDFHPWQTIRTGGAIVGAYPLPLKKRGVRLICAPTKSPECSAARRALTASGVVVSSQGSDRVIVGTWNNIEDFDGVRDLTRSGESNGAYAQFSADGRTLTPLSADGSEGNQIKKQGGLLSAFSDARGVVWLATGTDPAGVSAAVQLLEAGGPQLQNRFAMAVGPAGPIVLPERAGQ